MRGWRSKRSTMPLVAKRAKVPFVLTVGWVRFKPSAEASSEISIGVVPSVWSVEDMESEGA